jgi:hypothetical protein
MNTSVKLAVGAAIAGALFTLFMKQRARKRVRRSEPLLSAGLGRSPRGSQGFTLDELSGENAEWGGGSSGLNA